MKIFRAISGLSLMLAVAVSAFAMSVKTDYDKNFNLGTLRTFAFKEQRRGNNDPLKTNTLMSGRIKSALEAQLEANGYKESGDNPDFLVAYYASSKEKLDIESFGYGYPRYWRWGFGPDIWTRYYTEGSVVVDIIDAKNNQVVWRGLVTDTVSDNAPDQSEKQISNGAKELVKHFLKDIKKG
ncbi:MAG TPA: DUF4136 domain-containing protein [Pyrinomonadaceae bacterium]|jgi:hypothetical protein